MGFGTVAEIRMRPFRTASAMGRNGFWDTYPFVSRAEVVRVGHAMASLGASDDKSAEMSMPW